MNNWEIREINSVLGKLVTLPIVGKLKFKIAKLAKLFMDKTQIIESTLELEDIDGRQFIKKTKANQEIFDMEDNFEHDFLTYEELENLEISALDIIALEKIIKGAEDGNKNNA